MADVEMKEAATGSSKGKAVSKGTDASDKKKFEVKKVHESLSFPKSHDTDELSSGMPLPCGLGISSLTTVPFAETTSWTCVRFTSMP
jgi:hypothetical protein